MKKISKKCHNGPPCEALSEQREHSFDYIKATPLERSSLISLLPGNQSIPGVDFLIRPHFVRSRTDSRNKSRINKI